MSPVFFKTANDFREWLEKNHAKATELLVGYHKKGSGLPSITWPESVKQALCFGWIDGVRRSVDWLSYTIRFTPRKPTSTWSAINIKLVEKLIGEGRMHPAGMAAFKARKENKSGVYSYENRPHSLEPEYEDAFKKNKRAWAFFESQPPGYRRTCCYWVMSAKREETRLRRLETLISDSAQGRRIGHLSRPTK